MLLYTLSMSVYIYVSSAINIHIYTHMVQLAGNPTQLHAHAHTHTRSRITSDTLMNGESVQIMHEEMFCIFREHDEVPCSSSGEVSLMFKHGKTECFLVDI